jgi:hypothetical protein
MLLRSFASLALLAGFAAAQQDDRPAPIPQYAGNIDLSTGVFTPAPAGATLPAVTDVVYNNAFIWTGGAVVTLLSSSAAVYTKLDEGRVPSSNSTGTPGTLDSYDVKQYLMAYATSELDPSIGGPGTNVRIKFWSDYDQVQVAGAGGTSLAAAGTPLATYNFTGLNGTTNTTGTVLSGWIYTITLGTALTFDADAAGNFDNNANLDTFGLSYDVPTFTAGKATYVYYAGGPNGTYTAGDATVFQNPAATTAAGLGNSNFYTRDQAGVVNVLAGTATNYAGFYMKLIGDAADCNDNNIVDSTDITAATSVDCDGNAVPDECDIAAGAPDCNTNGALDSCEILINPALDANVNGIIDSCECGLQTSYCTSGTTTNGCVGVITGTGTPDANAGSGFTLTVSPIEGGQTGIIFYGLASASSPWGGASSSFLCVKAPLERTGVQGTGGTPLQCDGSMSIDWNFYIANTLGAVGTPFVGGEVVFAQGWFRDPPAPKTTSLSNGLSFTVCP